MTTEIQPDVRRGKTSASSAQADFLCPNRHIMQLGCPDVKSDDAESGSRIHAALSESPREGSKLLQNLSLQEREVYDACRSIEKKLITQFFGPIEERDVNGKDKIRVIREERYWARKPMPDGSILEHSGQPDVIFICGKKGLICEYKTLAGEVAESNNNLQLRDQVVLVRGNLQLDSIGVVVIQPFVTHNPGICLYEKEHIDKAEGLMWTRVAKSNDPKSPRIPGEIQCKWCLAKSKCEEYTRWAGSMVPTPQELYQVAMSEWTPDQRARAAMALAPAENMLEQIKEFLKAGLAKDPAFVPGFILKEGAKREIITDAQKCFDRFITLGGNSKQFMSVVKIAKGELKKAVNSVTGAKGIALDKAIDTLCDGIVEVKQNAPSLKKVDE